jgi:hypothetical protein
LRPSVKIRIASSSVLVLTTYSAASCRIENTHWLMLLTRTYVWTYRARMDYTCKVRTQKKKTSRSSSSSQVYATWWLRMYARSSSRGTRIVHLRRRVVTGHTRSYNYCIVPAGHVPVCHSCTR